MTTLKLNPATNLWPIGQVASHAGVTVQELERVITARGFEPIFALNGIPYFSMLQSLAIEQCIVDERNAAANSGEIN